MSSDSITKQGSSQTIALAQIKIGLNRRAVKQEQVELLANSIREIGLLSPVVISQDNTLVAGQHRLEAFKLLGRDSIPFVYAEKNDNLRLRLAEIDENITRNNGTELEQGQWLSERKRIYEKLHPETKASIGAELVSKRWNTADNLTTVSFANDTANQTGLSDRTIRRKIARAENIPQEILETIRETPIADNGSELDLIVKLASEEPEKVKAVVQAAIEKQIPVYKAIEEARPKTPVMQSSESNEYYTPAIYLEAARAVMGSIDLDPASCEKANKTVQATKFHTIETDGLSQPWHGNVWLNPPYGRLAGDFAAKLLVSYLDAEINQAIMLLNANITETKWFAPFWNYLVCFTNHRINFLNTDDKSGSTHGSLFVYLGHNQADFIRRFKAFGVVVKRVDK